MSRRNRKANVRREGFDEYSRQNAGVYHERSVSRSRKKSILYGVLIALAVLVVTGGVALAAWTSSIQSRLNGSNITEGLKSTLVDQTATDPYYVLLLGTDGRPGESDYRSDTIILVRIDPSSRKVTMISIPRDTKVTYEGETCKINATHTYGGAEGVVNAVNELCGVKISHYVEVSFDGFSSVVDALGGVEVDVPDEVNDSKAGDDVIEPGLQTLNGSQALTFCRSRAYPDGDYTRMRHQRLFMSALISQVESNVDPTTLVNVINSAADMVTTDMSVSDILGMVNSLRGIDSDNDIYSANIPSTTATIGGVSYVIADTDALSQMMDRVNAGEDPGGPSTADEGLDGSSL
ncbi:MAG: LCP family protein [Atopobiaceae bacterium]|jgi:LCP family protein required for cell wall assembly|nr:LCP family protein [Atopobiaceae bacterium]MCI2173550.1 LCP family protein [Atopobiaceae bacterium]MCI2207808.1 LCP family protein [Atopobiaceae bacterium]